MKYLIAMYTMTFFYEMKYTKENADRTQKILSGDMVATGGRYNWDVKFLRMIKLFSITMVNIKICTSIILTSINQCSSVDLGSENQYTIN